MVMRVPPVRAQAVQPYNYTEDSYKRGVVSQLDSTRLPKNAALQAINLSQSQNGVFQPRPGTRNYGQSITDGFDGWFVAAKDNGDGTSTDYIVVIQSDGVAKYSQDGGAWTTITGHTYTANKRAMMVQLRDKIWVANGADFLTTIDLASWTIDTYSGIDTPVGTTATRGGLSAGSQNAYYQVTAVNSVGETNPSSEFSVSGGINRQRDNWETDGTDFIDLSWTAVTDAELYNIYYGDVSGYLYYLGSTDTTSFRDDGSAQPNDLKEVPDDDTTTGPKLKTVSIVGNRIQGVDINGRVYGSGVGQNTGSFSPFFGGFFVDIEKGGKERPLIVSDFRSGKGDPVPTVLTRDNSGNGSSWQMDLITSTVGGTSIIIPAVYKTGPVGAVSPYSVVRADNSLEFASIRGVFGLGPTTQILNILVSKERTFNIRKDWRNLTRPALNGIASYERDGKIYWMVPNGSDTNNEVWVEDLEQRNWTRPWTLGFKGMMEYTDTDGITHFLAVPEDGTYIQEISQNFKGDNGKAFTTVFQTGLVHIDESHTGFAHLDGVYYELRAPRGSINLSVSGTRRNKSFKNLNNRTITSQNTTTGLSSQLFSTFKFSDPVAPSIFADASNKKKVKVNKPVNNWQAQLSSSDIDQQYQILRIHARGTVIPSTDSPDWKR